MLYNPGNRFNIMIGCPEKDDPIDAEEQNTMM